MTQDPDREKWNEFDWELELRKDDARVNAYAADLPKYIDLPDEDGLIMNRMRRRPDLAPAGGDWTKLGPVPYERDEEDEEDDEEDFRQESNWKKTPCAPVYRTTSRLVRDWCAFYASSGETALLVPTMRILCSYGKILARSGDLIDMALDPEDPPTSRPLKSALCKRLLSDVNALMGELFKLHAFSPETERKCLEHEDALTRLHDLLLDVLSTLRAGS